LPQRYSTITAHRQNLRLITTTMVKLSRPNSLTRTGSSNGSRWKKPIELTRSSSSKRWSFRQADSVSAADSTDGGYNTDGDSTSFILAKNSTASTGKSNKGSKNNNESKSASSAASNRVFKNALRRKESRKSSFDARDEEDENDFWNPFGAMFNEEDRDDDDSYYSDDDDYSASQMTVGTERTDDADASVGIFGKIARSVGNRLDPEKNDRSSDEDDDRDMEYARSTDRDSSSDVSAVDSSWDDDDDSRRDSNVDPHSYDTGEDSVAKGLAAKQISSKSREADLTHLYQFSSRVKVHDGESEKKESASKNRHSLVNMSRNGSFKKIIPKTMPKIAGVPALQRIRSGKKNTDTEHDETTFSGKSANTGNKNMSSANAHVAAHARDETVLQKMMTAARQASDSDIKSADSLAPTINSRHTEGPSKKAQKKEATKLKKEIKKRDKARKSELRRIEAEEKKQLKAQEREAQIAAAQTKKAEAEAKLAAIVAEAKLKKKQAEIEREEKLREAEIAAEEAKQIRRRDEARKAAEAGDAAAAAAVFAATAAVGTSAAAASRRRMDRLSLGRRNEKEEANWEEEEELAAAASQVRKTRSRSSSLPKVKSFRKETDPANGTETKRKIVRSRSLSRPRSFFKRNRDKTAMKEEDEEIETVVYNLRFKPSVEVEGDEEEQTLSRDMSRPSAVSNLLSQPSKSPVPLPLPVSPQHSTSSRSISTYDPTCTRSSPRSRASAADGSFVRSSTYNSDDLVGNEPLRPSSSLKRHPSPRRTVSFQRSDSVCNDVIVEEAVKDIVQDNVKNMNLQTNQKVSPRTGRTKNTFCIHEYDERGNQAVAYNEFGGDPIRSLKIYQYDAAPQIRKSSGDVLVKVQVSSQTKDSVSSLIVLVLLFVFVVRITFLLLMHAVSAILRHLPCHTRTASSAKEIGGAVAK